MAKGIDGYAHTACIKSGGYTLAFMGGGVDVCYPSEHGTLYERIYETGSSGSNRLILEGAQIYLGREQLIEGIEGICRGYDGEIKTGEMGSGRGRVKKDAGNERLSDLQRHIISLIEESPKTMHEIWRLCPGGCKLDSIEEALFLLELDTIIEQRGGVFIMAADINL